MSTRKIALLTVAAIIGVLACFAAARIIDATMSEALRNKNSRETKTQTPESPAATTPTELVAADESLGSGFTVSYPKEWRRTHIPAQNPTSSSTQLDENILVSPSGAIEVVMKTQTNIRTSLSCTKGFIDLKFLQASAISNYPDGRFAAYVVYFPSYNLRQYHVGLQKNTDTVKQVTLTNDEECNFLYSEFIERPSKIDGVPVTYTFLGIRFKSISADENLPPNITETDVGRLLTGEEYEAAKKIVESVRVE